MAAELAAARVQLGQSSVSMRASLVQRVLKVDLAFDHPPGPLDNAQDRARGDALATAALAHDAQRLAALDVQVDPVHGLDHTLVGKKVCLEVFDL